ncbi:alpha/beta fold hydrolase [Solimonas sp. K1W22B-7]|uniref:alpha/beta fold hydrolase n=1 Tax=Solimonas sp. K1W22B-7 TaxID=2303331 RepID=UPI000E33736E|nr:alpha/beta fold hydrolase [Solimonas sp. K1W22B-7]AXQ30178.1 alpha/beta fold hydrolase [Solimonas sp. K1W22B-7]
MIPAQLVTSDDVRIAVYTWGRSPTKQRPRPTLVLVHGYPDNAEVWAQLAERLAEHFHVVAYDVRGAGRSSTPRDTAGYGFEHLTADLLAVIEAVSPQRPVHLVAFDWGSLQGWEALLSGRLEGRVASFSTAAPGLDHVGDWFQQRLRQPTPRNLAQALRRALGSSYMVAFQLPLLPEVTWKLGLGRVWHRLVSGLEGVDVARHDRQTADGVQGLGLYRANLLQPLLRPQQRRTEVPVQLLVMRRDPFVPREMYEGLEAIAPQLQRREFDAGHWWPLTQPQAVADGISTFVHSIESA